MAQPASVKKFLIVGYGNTLRGDDGLGPMIADRLERTTLPDEADTRILALPQLDVSLVSDLQWADVAILVDARQDDNDALLDVQPVACPAAVSAPHHSTHATTVGTLLDMTRKWYGRVPRSYLVLPKGHDFSIGETITPEAHQAARCATAKVVEIIHGHLSSSRPAN